MGVKSPSLPKATVKFTDSGKQKLAKERMHYLEIYLKELISRSVFLSSPDVRAFLEMPPSVRELAHIYHHQGVPEKSLDLNERIGSLDMVPVRNQMDELREQIASLNHTVDSMKDEMKEMRSEIAELRSLVKEQQDIDEQSDHILTAAVEIPNQSRSSFQVVSDCYLNTDKFIRQSVTTVNNEKNCLNL